MKQIEVGTIIEFDSGMQYEIIKVYHNGAVDLKSIKPQFEWMPDFYPKYDNIILKNYKIVK